MKKTVVILALLGGVMFTNSFTSEYKSLEQDYAIAVAKKYRGIYVFMESEPKNDYEIIGDINKLASWGGSYEERRNGLIKKAKKKYPDCDGIIIYSKSLTNGLGASVIKYNK